MRIHLLTRPSFYSATGQDVLLDTHDLFGCVQRYLLQVAAAVGQLLWVEEEQPLGLALPDYHLEVGVALGEELCQLLRFLFESWIVLEAPVVFHQIH